MLTRFVLILFQYVQILNYVVLFYLQEKETSIQFHESPTPSRILCPNGVPSGMMARCGSGWALLQNLSL